MDRTGDDSNGDGDGDANSTVDIALERNITGTEVVAIAFFSLETVTRISTVEPTTASPRTFTWKVKRLSRLKKFHHHLKFVHSKRIEKFFPFLVEAEPYKDKFFAS
jgi:hypothetical protein